MNYLLKSFPWIINPNPLSGVIESADERTRNFGPTVKRSLYQFLKFQALVSSAWCEGIIKMRFNSSTCTCSPAPVRMPPLAARTLLFLPPLYIPTPPYNYKLNTNALTVKIRQNLYAFMNGVRNVHCACGIATLQMNLLTYIGYFISCL